MFNIFGLLHVRITDHGVEANQRNGHEADEHEIAQRQLTCSTGNYTLEVSCKYIGLIFLTFVMSAILSILSFLMLTLINLVNADQLNHELHSQCNSGDLTPDENEICDSYLYSIEQMNKDNFFYIPALVYSIGIFIALCLKK